MKKSALLLLGLVFLWSCAGTKKENTVTISGTIEKAIPQGEVILEKFEIGEIVPIHTAYSDHKGNFEIETTINGPGFYRLNIYGKQFETMVLDGEDLKVKATGEVDSPIEITGSDDMEYINSLYDYLGEYQVKVQDFNQKYRTAQQSNNQFKLDSLTSIGMEMEAKKVNKLKEMAWEFEGSLVSLLITDFIPNKTDEYSFLDSLSQKLQEELPQSRDVQYFSNQLDNFRPAVAIGDMAMDIELPNPDGENMKLSELRGKYVLLDFWAAWCKPCRRENPNVVNLYNKYKDDGFTVYSVSLDRRKDHWVRAIEEDGLVWPNHVSDLKYFDSKAAIKYKVNAIPFALLLDPEGRVIGKNLRGSVLREKLASIFGSNSSE